MEMQRCTYKGKENIRAEELKQNKMYRSNKKT